MTFYAELIASSSKSDVDYPKEVERVCFERRQEALMKNPKLLRRAKAEQAKRMQHHEDALREYYNFQRTK
jgi:hypothetical protein